MFSEFSHAVYLHAMIKAFHADRLYIGDGRIIRKGEVDMTPEGRIIYAGPERDQITKDEMHIDVDGALCPGFINTHTHLELCALKDKVF